MPSERMPSTTSSTENPHLLRFDVIVMALLSVITIALYARTATFGFINFDDYSYFLKNPQLQLGLSWRGIVWAFTYTGFPYWQPITWLFYLVLYSIFGASPASPHVLNFVVHTISVCILYIVVVKATGMRWRAALVAALWGWHPLRAESVAWVAETKDALGGLFWLLSILAYLNYARLPGVKKYLIVLGIFAISLMCKPTVVTLPAVLLLLDYWPLNRIRWSFATLSLLIAEKLPLLAMAITTSIVIYINQRDIGALSLNKLMPASVRNANGIVSIVKYLAELFWPVNLAIFYPHPFMVGQSIANWQWIGGLSLLLILTGALFLIRKRQPAVFLGWLWFIGTLFPMAGFVQAGDQAMADRHSLIPSIGITLAVVWAIAGLVENRPQLRRLSRLLATAALVTLIGISWKQIGYFRDTVTAFEHADEVSPKNYLAEAILVQTQLPGWPNLSEAKRNELSMLADRAVGNAPRASRAHWAKALVLDYQNQDKAALHEYILAAKLDAASANIRNDMGGLLVRMNRDDEAVVQFREAVRIKPSYVEARHNLAILLANHGKADEAIEQWRRAIQDAPRFASAHGWLADALRVYKHDYPAAIKEYRLAFETGATSPSWETNLAWSLATDPNSSPADTQFAIRAAEDAVKQEKAANSFSLDALGAALARAGQFDRAVECAKHAYEIAMNGREKVLAGEIQQRLAGYLHGQAYMINSRRPPALYPATTPSTQP